MIDYSKLDYAPLLDAYDKQTISKAIVGEISGKGHKVYVFGFPAYLPYTQVNQEERLEEGQEIEVCVIKIMPETNNIIVSSRVAIERKSYMDVEDMEIGMIVKARVKNITNYGVFATIGKIDGLIHNSELNHTWSHAPTSIVKIGEEILVKIIDISKDSKGRVRISLSYKQANPDPWELISIKEGDIVDSTVLDLTPNGVIVSIDKVEAFLHKSMLSWTDKNPDPSSYTKIGDTIRVKVQEINRVNKKIILSHRDILPNPWETLTLQKGDVIEAPITKVTDYCYHIKVSEGLEGILPSHNLGWSQSEIERAKQALKIGQVIRVVLTEINRNRRKLCFSIKHLNRGNHSEALALVRKDGKSSYINKAGDEVITCPENILPYSFSEGLAVVIDYSDGEKCGVIDKTGKLVVPYKYDWIEEFSEGLACVGKDDKYGFIDKTGKEVIPLIYDSADSFSEGLAVVKIENGGKWGKSGFINKTGEIVIPFEFDSACSFYEGLAAIALKDEEYYYIYDEEDDIPLYWGFIDKEGDIIIPCKYCDPAYFHDGFAVVESSYYISKSGHKSISPQGEPGAFSEGLAPVRRNNKFGFINKQGKEVIPYEYDRAYWFKDGLAAVKKNGKYGFIDKNGEIVIPFEYEFASKFAEGLAAVKKNGKYGFINKKGECVISFIYDDANDFSQ